MNAQDWVSRAQRIAGAASLGADLRSISWLLWSPFHWRLRGDSVPSDLRNLRLRAYGKKFDWFFRDDVGSAVLGEVFGEDIYRTELSEPRTIVDLGGHAGAASVYFKLRYPNAKLLAFEPEPRNFERLKANLAQFSDAAAYPYALGSETCRRTLHLNPQSTFHSFDSRPENVGVVNVECRTLDSVLEGLGEVDLLKFDVEGAEWEIFRAAKNLRQVKRYIGEVNAEKEPLDAFLRLFEGYTTRTEQVPGFPIYLFEAVRL